MKNMPYNLDFRNHTIDKNDGTTSGRDPVTENPYGLAARSDDQSTRSVSRNSWVST